MDAPPPLMGAGLPDKTQSLVLVGRDDDEPPPPGQEEPAPLWAVANISPTDLSGLTSSRSGRVVVPYRGPAPADEFIHRVFFRLYALKKPVPLHLLGSWDSLHGYLKRHGAYDN